MGRPYVLQDNDVLYLSGDTATSILQAESHRRAIAEMIFNQKGKASVAEINARFNFECRPAIASLMRSGWLKVLPAAAKKPKKSAASH